MKFQPSLVFGVTHTFELIFSNFFTLPNTVACTLTTSTNVLDDTSCTKVKNTISMSTGTQTAAYSNSADNSLTITNVGTPMLAGEYPVLVRLKNNLGVFIHS